MTVKQLKEAIAKYEASGEINDNTDVFISQLYDEYENNLAETAAPKEITFKADEDDTDPAKDICFVIKDNF